MGHQLYSLRANVNTANSRISARKRELDKIEEEIRTKEAAVIAADTTTEDRVLFLAELKRLSERTGEIEVEIEKLIEDRARHEYELADYESTVAAYGF